MLKEEGFIVSAFLAWQATAEANNLAAAASAKDIYYNNMEEVCGACVLLGSIYSLGIVADFKSPNLILFNVS